MKKILSVLLSITMLLSIIAGINLSAYAATKTGKCGTNVTYSFNTQTGKLTLSGSGKMKNYTYTEPNGANTPWISYASKIKSVVVKSGITSIGNEAFIECDNLKSVSLPNTITSIGTDAFYWCVSLSNISIPDSVTSIGSCAFFDVNFDNLKIPSSLTTIGSHVFCGIHTKSITIPSTVKTIGSNAFNGIEELTTVVISKNVKKIGNWAFSDCNNLKTITIPNTVTSIADEAFGEKESISSKNLRIIGYPNSSAQTYAEKYDIAFSEYVKVKLSSDSYTYDGDTHKPSVTVKDSSGNKVSSSYYEVSYSSGCKNVGSYTVKVKLKGAYKNTVTQTFKIIPKSTSISNITAKSKGFTVKWKKQSTQTTGYQIQYSTSSKFSNADIVTVSKNSTTSKTISNLKSKKTYYVRVRTYKTVNGKKVYSNWSTVKKVKTK